RTSLGSERVACIILAAGASSRMGLTKQLLEYDGIPLVQRAIDTAEASSADEVVVVTGADADDVEATIRTKRALVVRNPDYERGNMSSLEVGADAVPDVDAFVLLNADQPEIAGAVVDDMVNLWRAEQPWAAVARYEDRMAHPYLLSSECLAEAIEMGGAKVLWRLVGRDVSGRVVQLRVGGDAPLDVNTPEDYDRLPGNSGR
ncbi:MAG: nucleotidyltransferase family protein, partial [Acidimicrobiia bacterium]